MHLGVRWETASGRWGADVGQVNQAGAGRHRGRGCGRSGPGGSWCGITGPDHPGHGRGTDRGRADAVPGPSPAEAGEAVGARPLDGNGPPGLPRREVRRRPATRRPAWLARWRPGTADQTATAAPHPAIDETAIIQREPWGRLARGARHPACLSVGRNGPDQSLRKPPVLDPADGLTCHKPGL